MLMWVAELKSPGRYLTRSSDDATAAAKKRRRVTDNGDGWLIISSGVGAARSWQLPLALVPRSFRSLPVRCEAQGTLGGPLRQHTAARPQSAMRGEPSQESRSKSSERQRPAPDTRPDEPLTDAQGAGLSAGGA
ncbi:hypothetical protein AAFF_G00146330 [Aldrovandia affinis]|uniref:Uncharacterized protein n=1 Tax=Aldrovandia affinis TaxID=143900 RepID=A0AAD7RPX7_9TELE|nr:hypothetical protein AAFF_G00146330 [Aldrovandia affinis]